MGTIRIQACVGAAVLAASLLASHAHAALAIDVGDHVLEPNQAGQTVVLRITGGDDVAGLNLYVQVGDGTAGPVITDIDAVTGTIFESNNFGGDFDQGTVNARQWAWGVITASGTVTAEGLLATITFDTTGISEGSWDLQLKSPTLGLTDLGGTFVDVTPGTLAVPEPGTAALLGASLVGLLTRRR